MIGKIYSITNLLNGKKYIGFTFKTLDERFSAHVYDSKKHTSRPLYRAFNKYGTENFSIKLIEEAEEDIIYDREIYYINLYNTFSNGYNATKGGDGKRYLKYSDREVIDCFIDSKYISATALKLGIDWQSVKLILKNNNIDYDTKPVVGNKKLEIVELGLEYNSLSECARDIINCGISKGAERSVRSHIRECCNGNRKSAYGFTYKWILER